jgi:hypothetical protein
MIKYVITEHALFQMQRRGISESDLRSVIEKPERTEEVRPGRMVLQSKIASGKPQKTYLVRVIIDFQKPIPEVVTVYRTSKIDKYGGRE